MGKELSRITYCRGFSINAIPGQYGGFVVAANLKDFMLPDKRNRVVLCESIELFFLIGVVNQIGGPAVLLVR